MENEISLEYLFVILKKKLLLIITVAVLFMIAGFTVSNFFIEKKYESSALIYVENGQKSTDSLNINDINAAQKLVNTCQIIFKSNTMLDSLIENLNLPYTKTQLSDMITAQSVNNTEVMKITVVSLDKYESAKIVNQMLVIAKEEFDRIIKSGSFEIVDYGEISNSPSFPNIPLVTVASFIIGFALTYIIVFIKDIFDVVLKSDDNISKLYDVPVFAEIPDFDNASKGKGYSTYTYSKNKPSKADTKKSKRKRDLSREDHMLNDETPFSITEAYNNARTNILFAAAPHNNKIVVFTSANPSEGKSTTCLNTSISFAKAGYNVLLIDCDMRKPVVNKYFNITAKFGLSSVLGGFCSVGESINKDVIENLDVIAVGDIPPNPSELLCSENMKTFIDASVEIYDYIFIDTPPVNVVSDSLLMNERIAGIVLVVKENSTIHPDIHLALEKIKLTNGRALGFIKTCCTFSAKKYSSSYKKTYGYGYSYSSSSDDK